MVAWTIATVEGTPAGVILDAGDLERAAVRLLADPGDRVAEVSLVVERYWSVRWDLAADGPGFTSSLIPELSVNLTHEQGSRRAGSEGGVVLTGPTTRRFDAALVGRGAVVGIKLHPGAFTAITGTSAAVLTDRTVPAAEHLPGDLVAAVHRAASAPLLEQVDLLEEAATSLVPDDPPEGYRRARRLLAALRDPAITRVEQLAHREGIGIRSLQREFRHWIGIGPKQVLTRMRLQDVAADLAGPPQDLAALAVRLGFYDQAHLTREFSRFVGVSPARYAARPVGRRPAGQAAR
jgi:AraC-like DNA-binding protein